MGFSERYAAFDRFQRRHAWLGFPLAVRQKYADDGGGYLAATIAYYGFFSLFPLLLVFVTLLGYALAGHPHLQHSIERSTLGQLPIVGDQRVTAISGNPIALAVGIAGALWSGMRVVLASENGINQLWGVPLRRRADFLRAHVRALLLLLVIGGGALASSLLGGLAAFGAHFGLVWKLGSILLSTALNAVLFWVGFRVLVGPHVPWRYLRVGAIVAGVGYELLQILGGWYVGHVLANASRVYGTFALVIGLLSWIYLAAHVTLLAAEANVVSTRRLWPRSVSLLREQPATDADRRALRQRALVEERRQDQGVDVRFQGVDVRFPGDEPATDRARGAGSGSRRDRTRASGRA
jgi:YihY family inner membrane protein